MSPPDLETRARALVTDDLIRAYWGAVHNHATRDLVLMYVVQDARFPIRAFSRAELLASSFPDDLKAMLARPASDLAAHPAPTDATFWLLALFSEEEVACIPVNEKLMPAGGHA